VSVTVNGNTTSVPVRFFSSAAAGSVAIDVTGNGTFATGSNAASVGLSSGTTVSLRVKNSAGILLDGKPVVVTITGVGTFSDGTKSKTVYTSGGGLATVDVTSNNSGAQGITASADGISVTGTLTYGAPGNWTARNISVFPATDATVALEAGKQKVLRFKVTDGYGNAVPNVQVNFSNSDAGFFYNGGNSASAITNDQGIASVAITSFASSYGASNVTATIAGAPYNFQGTGIPALGDTECTYPVDNPTTGFKAGNCTTKAAVQFSPLPTLGGTSLRVNSGYVNLSGVVAPNASVGLYIGSVLVATTTSNATTGVYTFRRAVSATTSFTVKSGGLSSGVFKVTVKFLTIVSLKTTAGKVLVTAGVYPHVANVTVYFYTVTSGKRHYIGSSKTNASGYAVFTLKTVKGHTYTITAAALASAGRATSSYATARAIVSK
jgi:hypothetical protein